tara:strand:- start:885 stop:2033 length:1149 start_codon:yes stop_codon:yes gene_type:complete
MAKLLKLRRGTTTQHGSFTGAEGELTIDTTKDTAVVHDGSQAGGRPLLREDLSNLPAGTIDNADVNASAAIAGTKISPDFGSQDITTTGKIKFANVYTNESDLPSASTYHGMFAHVHSTGHAYFAHGGSWHKLANISGAAFTGNISTTGNITVTGTVDGRDVAADGTKLDGIETAATADQTASEIVALVADQTIAPSEIDMEDNEKIKLGTGDDLEIYHSGSHSKIADTGTGSLILSGSAVEINNAADSENMIKAVENGAVELYYDNSKKLETVTGGVSVTGDMTASGNVTAYSDAKLKTEIHRINDALGIVGKLRGVNYKWLSNGQSDIGVIAQEVEEVIPEVVKETEDGTKTVDYSRIVSVLINAVNELKAEVEELKGGK